MTTSKYTQYIFAHDDFEMLNEFNSLSIIKQLFAYYFYHLGQ